MTEQKHTGGQAFPLQPASTPEMHHLGMTLRDWFAGQAMAASCNKRFVAGPGESAAILQADWAYLIADAMLEARK